MFCSNCGKEIPNNTNFCNYCGAAQNNGSAQNMQSTVSSSTVHTVSHSSNTKKNSRKKNVGIVLVCLQILAFIGGISNGTILSMLVSGTAGYIKLICYCWMGILGSILIYKANKEEKGSK